MEKISHSPTSSELYSPSEVGLKKEEVVEKVQQIRIEHPYKGKILDFYA